MAQVVKAFLFLEFGMALFNVSVVFEADLFIMFFMTFNEGFNYSKSRLVWYCFELR